MVNNVLVEDASLEVFPFYFSKLIITAISYEWALTSVRTINHPNYASIVEKLDLNQEIGEIDYFFSPRIGVDQRLEHTKTPDYRPGISLIIGGYDLETVKSEVFKRLYALNCPSVSIFDGFSSETKPEDSIAVQGLIQILSGDSAIKAKIGNTIVWSMPTSEGTPCRIQPEFKIKRGFMGASFLICGTSQKDTLKATMNTVDTIQAFDEVFCPFPAGISRLGTRFGATQFYPTLVEKFPDTKVPRGVKCIYEIEVDGISLDSIKKALKAGILTATQSEGIKRILTRGSLGNYNGEEIPLQTLFES